MLDAARASALVSAAALPFSTAAMSGFAALAVLLWALSGEWRPAARRILDEPAAWIAGLLALLLVAGVAWSRVPAGEALRVAWKYRELLLFCVVMVLFADTRWRWRLVAVLFWSTLALLALSYVLFLTGTGPENNAVYRRTHITHSFMMSVLAFGAAAAAIRAAGWRRWVFGLVAALAVVDVFVAVQGRTGYVVLAALVVFLAAARWSARGVAAALLAVALLLAAAYQFSPTFQARVQQTFVEAQELRTDEETSIAMRRHYVVRSAQWLAAHPLIGAGTGGWGEAFFEATAGDPPLFHDRRHTHPHSEYLNLGVQLGIAGLLLLVALFAVAYRSAARLQEPEALLARGVVVAFAVGCLFNDFLMDSTEGHLWALLGGALFGAPRASHARR